MEIGNTPPEYFIESYLLKSSKKKEAYQKSICSGNLKDYEEYRHCSGKLKGIIEADEMVIETYNSLFSIADRDIKTREFYANE